MKTILTLVATAAALSAVSFAPANAAPVSKVAHVHGATVDKVHYRGHRMHCHWVKRVVWHHGHRHVTNVRVCR